MRKIAGSSKAPSRIRLSACAEARSWPNGFSMMTRAPFGAARLGQLLDDQPEQRGRDGEVVRRPLGGAELLADGLERRRVVVVAVDVAQQAGTACRTPPDRARRASPGCRAPGPEAGRASSRPWPRR